MAVGFAACRIHVTEADIAAVGSGVEVEEQLERPGRVIGVFAGRVFTGRKRAALGFVPREARKRAAAILHVEVLGRVMEREAHGAAADVFRSEEARSIADQIVHVKFARLTCTTERTTIMSSEWEQKLKEAEDDKGQTKAM